MTGASPACSCAASAEQCSCWCSRSPGATCHVHLDICRCDAVTHSTDVLQRQQCIDHGRPLSTAGNRIRMVTCLRASASCSWAAAASCRLAASASCAESRSAAALSSHSCSAASLAVSADVAAFASLSLVCKQSLQKAIAQMKTHVTSALHLDSLSGAQSRCCLHDLH